MAEHKQPDEAAYIRPLHNRQAQEAKALEYGDQTGDHKDHSVKIGDLLIRQMECATENPRKHEHPCHSEDVLERQDDVLAKWKLLIDAYVEDLLRPGTGSLSHACHVRFSPSKAHTSHAGLSGLT